jgi:hypothetical protein
MVFAELTEAQTEREGYPLHELQQVPRAVLACGLRLLPIRFFHDGFALIVLLCFLSKAASDALPTPVDLHFASNIFGRLNSGRPLRAFICTLLESSGDVKQQSTTLGGGSIWLA